MHKRLLVGHFLRRFLDNDLVSPDADRHEAIAVTLAALVSSGLVLTLLCSIKYLFRPVQSRGWTVVVSLDDTFLYCGISMAVMALVALAVWDALSLDARDTAILGALPVRRGTIATAQVAAVALFALAFAIASNAVPSLLAPLIRISRLPVGLGGLVWLVAAHAAVSMAAGLFGFAVVLGTREVLRAGLGSTLFARVSPVVQGLLVVLCATFLLTLPSLSADVDRRWLEAGRVAAMPPLWFVGLHESLTGNSIAGLPRTNPPADAPRRDTLIAFETRTMDRYHAREPLLAALGDVAIAALTLVLAASAAACAWNSRRLPAPPSSRSRPPGRVHAALAGWLMGLCVRRPLTRAGFVFTLQALSRSVPHRVALATSLGVAVAAAAACLRWADRDPAGERLALQVLAIQPAVLGVLVAGFRHATRVPAELAGRTTFVLSMPAGGDRPFRAGVKRAGLVFVGLPPIVLLAGVHMANVGASLAVAHALVGVLLVLVLLELAFSRPDGLPFVTIGERSGNPIALAPIYLLAACSGVWLLAWIEREALASTEGAAAFLAALTIAWGVSVYVARRQSTTSPSVLVVPDAPAGVSQPLTLHD